MFPLSAVYFRDKASGLLLFWTWPLHSLSLHSGLHMSAGPEHHSSASVITWPDFKYSVHLSHVI